MSYGYTLNLVSLNKSASARSLGVKLGRSCIKHGVPVSGKTKPSAHAAARIEKFIIRLER